VKTPLVGPPVYFFRTSAVVRFSSRDDDLREPDRLRVRGLEAFFFGECSRQYFGSHDGYLSSDDCGTENSELQTWQENFGIAKTVRQALA